MKTRTCIPPGEKTNLKVVLIISKTELLVTSSTQVHVLKDL